MRQIIKFLQIRTGEEGIVLSISLLFVLLNIGLALGLATAETLFNLRVGTDKLPDLFIIGAIGSIVFSLLYTFGLSKFKKKIYFPVLAFIAVIVLFVEHAYIPDEAPTSIPTSWQDVALIYPILWVTIQVLQTILKTTAWNMAGAITTARQAKRLFALFGGASTFGVVLGNALTSALTKYYESSAVGNLLYWQGAFIAGGAALMLYISVSYLRGEGDQQKEKASQTSQLSEMAAGFRVVWSSRLMRQLAVISVLTSILFVAISIPFESITTQELPTEAQLLSYKGNFRTAITILTLVVSIFLTNRLTKKLGAVNIGFLMVGAYLVGLLLIKFDQNLFTATAAKSVQNIVLNGVYISSGMVFFNVLPKDKRAQANAFINGAILPIGLILSSAIQKYSEANLSLDIMLNIFIGVALLTGFLTWRMQGGYREALLHALRAGRVEVFRDEGLDYNVPVSEVGSGALDTLVKSLNDPQPMVRSVALDILGRIGDPQHLEAMMGATQDENPEVQRYALNALKNFSSYEPASAALFLLSSFEPDPKIGAMEYLAEKIHSPSPITVREITRHLNDPDPRVVRTAAKTLSRYGKVEDAGATMLSWIQGRTVTHQAQALLTLGEMIETYQFYYPDEPLPAKLYINKIFDALNHPTGAVRRAACQSLVKLKDPKHIPGLLSLLGDQDKTVRQEVAQALKQYDDMAEEALIPYLSAEKETVRHAALDALPPHPEHLHNPVTEFAKLEVDRLIKWRQINNAFLLAGKSSSVLKDTLEQRALDSETQLVKALAILEPEDKSEWAFVIDGLQSSDPDLRAAAVETLDTLGDTPLAKEIILPRLDNTTLESLYATDETALNPIGALASLFDVKDDWVQSLAAGVAAELKMTQLIPDLEKLAGHPSSLVQESANYALNYLKAQEVGVPGKTLQTLSSLERIVLLRDVPLFADLSIDDLRQLADVAFESLFEQGESLVEQDQNGQDLYIISEGEVEVKIRFEDEERAVRVNRKGDYFGEMAILETAPRSASVYALSPTRALVIDGDSFKSILRDRPEVAMSVMTNLSRRLREMNDRFVVSDDD